MSWKFASTQLESAQSSLFSKITHSPNLNPCQTLQQSISQIDKTALNLFTICFQLSLMPEFASKPTQMSSTLLTPWLGTFTRRTTGMREKFGTCTEYTLTGTPI